MNNIKELRRNNMNNSWNEYRAIHWKLSESYIEEHLDELDINILCQTQKLSETFIKRYKDIINWELISHYQVLSEDFIREYKDYVDWYLISRYQILSESFIEEFKDYVYWEWFQYRNFSLSFMDKYSLLIKGE